LEAVQSADHRAENVSADSATGGRVVQHAVEGAI